MNDATHHRWRPGRFVGLSVAVHGLVIAAVLTQPSVWPWALAVFVGNHLLITLVGLWPRSTWLGSNWTRLPARARARNEIALTIDDGPDPAVTPKVLDILDQYSVKASFFCIGEKALKYTGLCREIVRRGHAIENHSMHHRHNFSLLGVSGFTREIESAQQTLSDITGQRPLFFRAPAGLRNPFLDPVLDRLDLQLVSWSKRGFDTRVRNAECVTNRLIGGLEAGAILLLHDGNAAAGSSGRPVILDVLPELIDAAQDRQLKFVVLRDVLQ